MMYDVSDEYAKHCEKIADKMWAETFRLQDTYMSLIELNGKITLTLDKMGRKNGKNTSNLPKGDAEAYRIIACLFNDMISLETRIRRLQDCYNAYYNVLSLVGTNAEISDNDVTEVLENYRVW